MTSALTYLRGMAENNAWSNQRLYAAVAVLSHDELFAETRTSFFPSIAFTLEHILLVDRFYMDAVERGENDGSVYELERSFKTFEALAAGQRAEDARLVRVVAALDEAALQREVTIHWRAGTKREAIGDVLPHLFVHQIHHRGQVHAMLAGTKVKPPQLDEFFLAVDRQQRDREMAQLRETR